jgi:P-type Cu2+ transporter
MSNPTSHTDHISPEASAVEHAEPETHGGLAHHSEHGDHAGHDAHAGHEGHGGHDKHAGHDPEMFRRRFWGGS